MAIGADEAIRVNAPATDGFYVAKQLANIANEGEYDLIIGGRESIDYNGGMVPGMIAKLTGANFVNMCINIEVEANVSLQREIDGGKETLTSSFPIVLGAQKGLVEESDLIIPNMRGIMQARQKPLDVVAPANSFSKSSVDKFEKPPAKGSVKLVDPDNIDELISLLHNEAKVI